MTAAFDPDPFVLALAAWWQMPSGMGLDGESSQLGFADKR